MPLTSLLNPVFGVFLAVFLLAAAAGAVSLQLAEGKRRRARLAAVAGRARRLKQPGRKDPASVRRGEAGGRFPRLERLLRRLVPRQEGLRARLARSGYEISVTRFLMLCLLLATIVGGLLFVMTGARSPVLAGVGGIAAGWLLPNLVFGMLARRRVQRFLVDLPEAIDVLVRGLKSGLPVTEMIATVGNDFSGPIGAEFKRVADNLHFGMTLDQALWDAARRLDIAEFNFLAISIGVQRETGGNLTETLVNLSTLLRKRHQMGQKVKALSSEARTSAYIVGALPFLMVAILMFVNPDYAGRLFFDPQGHWFLAGAIATEVVGALVMFKMARFEI